MCVRLRGNRRCLESARACHVDVKPWNIGFRDDRTAIVSHIQHTRPVSQEFQPFKPGKDFQHCRTCILNNRERAALRVRRIGVTSLPDHNFTLIRLHEIGTEVIADDYYFIQYGLYRFRDPCLKWLGHYG